LTTRRTGSWRSGPLADRNFRLLAAGQFTSTLGDLCYAVALPWLVLASHHGAALLGTVLACYGVPRTLAIPVGGWLADKTSPRLIMLAADLARGVLVAFLVALALRHVTALALLGPLAALLGAGEGLFVPASFSIMPGLVRPDQLTAANGISTAATQLGSLLGPVLGGALVATAGSAPAFAVDAATFAVSAASLALIRAGRPVAGPVADPVIHEEAGRSPSPAPDSGSPAGPGPEPAAGPGIWALLRQERLLQVIVGVSMLSNLAFAGTFDVALPALSHARYGAGGYGALMACLGGGAVAGTLLAARAGQLSRPAVTACMVFLGEAAIVAALPFLGGLPGACAAAVLLGVANGFANIVIITLLQQWAPARLLGRVMSLIMLAGLGVFPISALVTGALVHSLGPAPFFPVAGALLAVAIVIALSQEVIRSFGRSQPPATAEPGGATA
jgi:MFS family permease